MKTIINPDNYAHDTITWWVRYKKWYWIWFKAKEKDSKICINLCPECWKENNAMVVSEWICNWCWFNPNK